MFDEIGHAHGVRGTPTRSRGLSLSEVSMCSIARSGWPAQALRTPLTNQPRAKLGVSQRPVDQPDHGVDILAELTQYMGGVDENARVVLSHLECLHCFRPL